MFAIFHKVAEDGLRGPCSFIELANADTDTREWNLIPGRRLFSLNRARLEIRIRLARPGKWG